MKKIIYLCFFTIFSIIASTFIWELIQIPYNGNKNILGSYSLNQYNPSNEILRFISFISIPLITFFITYKILYKDRQINIYHLLKFENDNELTKNNFYYLNYFFFILLILEFLNLDFKNLIGTIDIVHHGTMISPAMNLDLTNNFWLSSFIEKGFFANFGVNYFWKYSETQTIGSFHLFFLIQIFVCKLLIVILMYLISEKINFDKRKRLLFFIIITIAGLTFFSYEKPIILGRFLPILIFFILLLKKEDLKFFSFNYFLIGLLSSFSMIWYIDIGAYLNSLIFLLIAYHIILNRKLTKLYSILFGLTMGWLMIMSIFSVDEFKEFIFNTIYIFNTSDFYNGLIFPTPFLSGNTRATKALLLIILTGIITIIFLFDKKQRINNNGKFFFLFLYIASLLVFKYALSRSDGGHIRTGIGFNTLLFYIQISFLLVSYFEKIRLNNNIISTIVFIFLSLTLIYNIFNFTSKKNILLAKKNITKLIYAKDDLYLNEDYIKFIDYYKTLSINDKCFQNLTNDPLTVYLIKKPSCTQFYFMYFIAEEELQKKMINQLKNNKPNYIIYEENLTNWNVSKQRLKLIFNYVNDNYSFYEKFEKWTIYMINK